MAGLIRLGSAQGTILVQFPDASPRVVWLDNPARKYEGTRVKTQKSSLELPYPSPQLGDRLLVLNEKSGNVAIRLVQKLTPGGRAAAGDRTPPATWTLTPADDVAVAQVEIALSQGGKPVSAANIRVKDRQREQSVLLTPSDQGRVRFEIVAMGPIRVAVDYKTLEGDSKSTEQTFELERERTEVTPRFEVALSDSVATLGSSTPQPPSGGSASGSQGGEPVKTSTSSAPPASSPMQIVLVLAGLVLGAGLIIGGLALARRNPQQLEDALRRAGVKIPDPGEADPPAGPVTPAPMQPAPMQPIVLPDADPAAPQPAATMGPVTPNQPRLVLPGGGVLNLTEGTHLVGREPGLALSLPDESTLSRRHAEVVRAGNEVRLRDLGSTNGTFVNGVPLQGEVQLKSGDAVQFGAVQTRFEG